MSIMDRPNVILITTDQQRYDTLGMTGNVLVHTPHIDALAQRGTLFERAYLQNPVCIPSRACLQTGRYTHQHGITYNAREIHKTPGLPQWEVTFMERLQLAGYRTGATGKMHMMPPRGFNYERLCGGKGYRWTQSQGSPLGPGPLGPTYASWLEARHRGGYELIYEQRRRPEYQEYMTAISNVLPLEEYVDYWVAEQAIEFLHYPGPKPFFLWCGFCGPHAPIDPPHPYDKMYPFEEMPLPKSRVDDPQLSPKGWPHPWWGTDVMKIRRWRSFYLGLVTLIDDMVGRIMSVLDERGLWENTLIILTSDHGDMAGDYNMMEKGNFYEEIIHVPLIVVPPGSRPAPPRVDGLVEVFDLAPTILDYAGVEIPPQMQASSLRPLVEGHGGPRDCILCEHTTNDRTRKGKCLRTPRHKYIFWGAQSAPEFYDLQEDPDELRNLHNDPLYRNLVEWHKDLLLDRLMQSERHYFRDETPSPSKLRTWM